VDLAVDLRKAGAEVAQRLHQGVALPKAAMMMKIKEAVVAASPNQEVDRAQVQRKAVARQQPRRQAQRVCQYNHGDRSKWRKRKAKKPNVLTVW